MLQGFKSQSGQTLYDLIIATYGSLDYAYKFLSDNPNASSFDFNTSGTFLYDPSVYSAPKKKAVSITKNIDPVIIAEDGQSVYDLAIMAFGDVSKVVNFITGNIVKTINDTGFHGKKITFQNSALQQAVGAINSHYYNNVVVEVVAPTSRAFSRAFSNAFA